MFKHYFRIALRSFLKNRVFSFIHVTGLGIGLAAFLLIALYVQFERSFDQFSPNAHRIYRVALEQYINGELSIASAENYPGVGPAMKADIPGVQAFARMYNMGYKNNVVISWENTPSGEPIQYKHRNFLYADSAFLPMMGYPMAKGNAATALAKANTAVISQKYANLYFGQADPIGKQLRLQDDDFNNELVTVTGVFENVLVNNGGSNLAVSPDAVETGQLLNTPNKDFKVFPNPARNDVNLDLTHFIDEEVQVRIYNHQGQVVLQKDWSASQKDIEQLTIANLPSGTYVIEIQTGENRFSKKLIKADW